MANIKNLENGKNTQFGKGQDPTKGGRRKSVINEIWAIITDNDKYEKELVMSKEDKYKFIEMLLEMPLKRLQKISENSNLPVFMLAIISAIISDLQEGKTTTVDKYFDRFYGSAKSTADIKVTNKINPQQYQTLLDKLLG